MAATRSSLALCALLLCDAATTQELEPRAYTNVPVGMNILIAGYAFTDGGFSADPSLPIEDVELEQHTTLLAYSRSFGLLGRLAKIDLIAPYSWLSGTATALGQPVAREVAGLNDPRFRFTYNFYGAPALSVEEWARRPDDLVVGVSLLVTAPLGQYNDERVVNLGTNRWTVKPELGASKSWGPISLELSAGVTIFEDNEDFVGATREQDPLYALQSHLVYSFRRSLWVALDGTYYLGGRTELDGVPNDDRQSSSRVGLTFSAPLSSRMSLKLYGSTAVSTRVGGSWDAVGITWQVRWGAGL
ncbi:MAG TPA: transporter [Myxococcota bacterium]|nr:transporter [Myxococcota bacterium]